MDGTQCQRLVDVFEVEGTRGQKLYGSSSRVLQDYLASGLPDYFPVVLTAVHVFWPRIHVKNRAIYSSHDC